MDLFKSREKAVRVSDESSGGYYAVVNGSILRGLVPGEKEPDFYYGRKSKYEYEQLLLNSQPYFRNVLSGKIPVNDPYYYIYSKRYIDTSEYDKKAIADIKVRSLDIWIKNPVTVQCKRNGFIYSGTDGRHRFVAARELKCDILVYVNID
ncbi:MAG: hypothetical protein K5852_07020 [Eubacterium sp.]|nr:hypothetical protein [Eubacterium sp.]